MIALNLSFHFQFRMTRSYNEFSEPIQEMIIMNEKLRPLFTPWKIGNCEIKNRIVMTSMGGTNLFGWMEINHFDKAGARFIKEAAENNAGLVLPGCQPVYNPMYGQWLHKNKKMFRDLAKWMPQFHQTGAKLFVQLTAGFGRSFTITEMMEKLYTNKVLRMAARPVMDLDKITASASPSPNRWSDKVPSREMSVEEIHEFIDSFARCAQLLQEAGVDGVEIHAVHEGYLLDQFTLKYVNHRNDEYGGSLENRYRFAAEIVKAIKEKCGKDFPVSLRYSVVSKTKGFRSGALPEEPYTEAGRDMEESILAAKYLEEAGYDMLNCDNGTYDAWYWAHPPVYMPKNCNLADVIELRKHVDIPVVCAGRMDVYTAADAIHNRKIDAAGFARAFLADRKWVTKLINDQANDIRPCILCHNGCFNMSHYSGVPNDQDLNDSLHLARCAVDAECMQWDKHYIKKTKKPKTVRIIGGGIAGMEAARVLRLRGHHPVIYEKDRQLGGVFIAGTSEPYKADMRQLISWYRRQMKALGIEVHMNEEIHSVNEFPHDPVIIATGAAPMILRNVKGHEKMIDAVDFLNGQDSGDQVAVIGGGLTGCEIAYELYQRNHKPFIVEMKNDLIAAKGVCLANSSYLREFFAWKQIPVYLETRLLEVRENEVVLKDKDGNVFTRKADTVISAAGYIPSPLADHARKDVYIIGDAKDTGTVKTAVWSAYEAAMKI